MTGYEKSRFVDLTADELAELTCGVCLGVLNDPLETKCCRKSYCAECINNWLKKNNNCPNDRKKLTKNELIGASKITLSLLSKLRIRCDHFDSGCLEVFALESLPKHRQECRYNLCANCGDVMGSASDHNCQRSLKSKVSQLENRLNQINGNLIRANKLNAILIATLKKNSIRVCFKCGDEGHDAKGCSKGASGAAERGAHRGGGQAGRGAQRGGGEAGRGARGAGRGQHKAKGGKRDHSLAANVNVDEDYEPSLLDEEVGRDEAFKFDLLDLS